MLSNRQLKQLHSLKQRKFRTLEQKYLIEGVRLCQEALASGHEIELFLYEPVALAPLSIESFRGICRQKSIPVHQIGIKSLKMLADTATPQGVMAVVKKQSLNLPDLLRKKPQNLVALENVRDPGNLGTICRTASWFGIDALLLGRACVELVNPKVIRASMGAVFQLPVIENVDLGRELVGNMFHDFSIWLADVSGRQDYSSVLFSGKNLLILGGETEEIADQIKRNVDATINIPGTGKCNSLNVAIAAGILLAEITRNKETGEPERANDQ